MKQLEEYLSPLLDRMRRSAVWFLGVLIASVAIFSYIGWAIGTVLDVNSDAPEIVGLVVGALVFIGLFALMTVRTRRRLNDDGSSLKAAFAHAEENTIRLLEIALDMQLTFIEAVMEVLKAEIPEKAGDLDAALAELKKQRDDLLNRARRPPSVGELRGAISQDRAAPRCPIRYCFWTPLTQAGVQYPHEALSIFLRHP